MSMFGTYEPSLMDTNVLGTDWPGLATQFSEKTLWIKLPCGMGHDIYLESGLIEIVIL